MPEIAQRLGLMSPSGTAAVFGRVAELRAQGVDIVSLSVGEPDFDTPAHIVEAAVTALQAGATRYSQVPGLPSLRNAISRDSKLRRGVEHAPDEIIVGVGAKHVLYNLAQVLYDPGDRVLIPTPCWGSYVEQARLCGAEAVLIPSTAQEGFLPPLSLVAQELARGAKALVICTPNNPTGAVFPVGYLEDLAKLLAQHDCFVVVDEIYAHLQYTGVAQTSLLTVAPELRERLLVVDGASKAYAMTGLRVGWLLGPRPVVAAVERLQGQAITHVAGPCQLAAEAALNGDQGCIEVMRQAYQARRDLLVAGLSSIDGFDPFPVPEGAFYVFAGLEGLLGRAAGGRTLATDIDVATWLLEEAGVAGVPGTAFFAPGHLRFSYATATHRIEEALERIARAVATLLPKPA